jgi:hypothetical protein
MQFTMTPLACDNAAFEEQPATELARILRHIARAIERGDFQGQAVDANGNTVGSWLVTE